MKFAAIACLATVVAAANNTTKKTNNTTKKTVVKCAVTSVETFTDKKCATPTPNQTNATKTATAKTWNGLITALGAQGKCSAAHTLATCDSNGFTYKFFSDANCTKAANLTAVQKTAVERFNFKWGACNTVGTASFKLSGTGPKATTTSGASTIAASLTAAAVVAATLY